MDDELIAKILKLREEGLSIRSIAKEVGKSKSFVFSVLHKIATEAAEKEVEEDVQGTNVLGTEEEVEEPVTEPETEGIPSILPKPKASELGQKGREALDELAQVEIDYRKRMLREAEETRLLERQAVAAERLARAKESELKTLLAQVKVGGNNNDMVQLEVSSLREEIAELRESRDETRRELESRIVAGQIETLKHEIEKIGQTGKTQYDVIDSAIKEGKSFLQEALPGFWSELRGLREIVVRAMTNPPPMPGMMMGAPQPITDFQANALARLLSVKEKLFSGEPLTLEERQLLAKDPIIEFPCPRCNNKQSLNIIEVANQGTEITGECRLCGYTIEINRLVRAYLGEPLIQTSTIGGEIHE